MVKMMIIDDLLAVRALKGSIISLDTDQQDAAADGGKQEVVPHNQPEALLLLLFWKKKLIYTAFYP